MGGIPGMREVPLSCVPCIPACFPSRTSAGPRIPVMRSHPLLPACLQVDAMALPPNSFVNMSNPAQLAAYAQSQSLPPDANASRPCGCDCLPTWSHMILPDYDGAPSPPLARAWPAAPRLACVQRARLRPRLLWVSMQCCVRELDSGPVAPATLLQMPHPAHGRGKWHYSKRVAPIHCL